MRRRTILVSDISSGTAKYDRAVEWLAANDIDPLEVPMDSVMVVDADSITYERCPRAENGAYKIEQGGERLVRETATVHAKQPPESFGL